MNYIVCTTGRGRSSVLMFYLKQLGAGFPEVWTNPWFNRERDFSDFQALCAFIQSREVDGHCAMRMTWQALLEVCKTHNVKAKAFFDRCLPNAKYIYFTRDNLCQAVESIYYQCIQTLDAPPDFLPRKDIESMLIDYATDETCWELFFSKYQIQPLRVSCEALIEDQEATCRRILEFLGIRYPEGRQLRDRSTDMLMNHQEVEAWYTRMLRRYVEVIDGRKC